MDLFTWQLLSRDVGDHVFLCFHLSETEGQERGDRGVHRAVKFDI